MEIIRQVIACKRYFLDFYEAQTDDVQRKIEWTLNLLRTIERVPKKYFDHMTGTDGLYEVRVESNGNTFRIFAFFDKHRFSCIVFDPNFKRLKPVQI